MTGLSDDPFTAAEIIAKRKPGFRPRIGLILGTLAGQPVACMKGRGHFYERGDMAVMTAAVRTLRLLG